MKKEKIIQFILLVLIVNSHVTPYAFEIDLSLAIENIKEELFPFSGPNCHNTTLRTLELMSTKRYVHEPEMIDIINNQCSEVSLEKAHFGVLYLNDRPKPYHSFTPLHRDNLVFTKNGVSKTALPTTQSYNKMYRIHQSALKTYCHAKKIEPCRLNTKYYYCQTISPEPLDLGAYYNEITKNRVHFFHIKNQLKLLEMIKSTKWTNSNCLMQKHILQSYMLSINLLNMSSLGKEERLQTENLYNQVKEVYKRTSCNQ